MSTNIPGSAEAAEATPDFAGISDRVLQMITEHAQTVTGRVTIARGAIGQVPGLEAVLTEKLRAAGHGDVADKLAFQPR